jgi:hypothetical protein
MRPDYAEVRFDCPERVGFEDLAVGDSASMQVSGLGLADFVRYAGASGDFTPFHYDREYAREEGYRQPAPATWRRMNETGVLGDTLLQERRKHITISFAGQGVGIEALPFDRSTQVAFGPNARLYHGWTDSLQIHATSLDGTTKVIANVPTTPVPVTDADRDSALTELERTDIREQFNDAFPKTKPAFADFLVSDNDRLWVQRLRQDTQADTVPWWILAPDTKTIHQVRLPRQVELEVVRDGQAYGTTTTDTGAPALVRYRIDTNA